MPDLNTRAMVNDAVFGSYYFWWTSLTYLPLFFFGLTLISFTIFTKIKTRSPQLIFLFASTIIYSTELTDYILLNVHWDAMDYSTFGVNTLLTNTLNRYHPFVFYFSTVLLGSSLVIISINYRPKCAFYLPYSLRSLYFLFYAVILVNLIALWMGSWWALQEGTWGGWWNWDSSEVFGLLVSLSALWILHSSSTLVTVEHLRRKIIISTSSVMAIYFFIQLNFDLVSHNFGAKFFFFSTIICFFLKYYPFLYTSWFLFISLSTYCIP